MSDRPGPTTRPSAPPVDSGQLSRLYDALTARLSPADKEQVGRLFVALTAMLPKSVRLGP